MIDYEIVGEVTLYGDASPKTAALKAALEGRGLSVNKVLSSSAEPTVAVDGIYLSGRQNIESLLIATVIEE